MYFKDDKSNGLAKADTTHTADDLFELVGHGCLYVVPAIASTEPNMESASSPVPLPSSELIDLEGWNSHVRKQ